jgi:hypothetical protein
VPESITDLNTYLASLTKRIHPIDSKELINQFQMHAGEEAKNIKLPELSPDDFIPPDQVIISKLYQLFRPVLKELELCKNFDWTEKYAQVKAKVVAINYLNASTQKYFVKASPINMREMMVYKKFIDHVINAFVSGVDSHEFFDYIADDSELNEQLEFMIDNMALAYPTQCSLITYFKSKNIYSIAYLTSLISEEKLERALCLRLQIHLLEICEYLYEAILSQEHDQEQVSEQLNYLPKEVEIKQSYDLQHIFTLYQQMLETIVQYHLTGQVDAVMRLMNQSRFFYGFVPVADIHDENPEIRQTQNMQLAIESARIHLNSQQGIMQNIIHLNKAKQYIGKFRH